MRAQYSFGLVVGLSCFAAMSSACGGASAPPASPTAVADDSDDPSCPIAVPGTSVTVEDTDTGAALVFITTGDVGEVRRRVVAMAQMHNDMHGKMGPLPDGSGAGGDMSGHDMSGMKGGDMSGHDMGDKKDGDMSGHDMGDKSGHDMSSMGKGEHAGHGGGMISVHAKAVSDDVDGGARLVLTVGPDDIGKLQSELRMHAQHMASGTCEMSGVSK